MSPDLRSQRPRPDKLGLKPGLRIQLHGVEDADFLAEVAASGAVVVGPRSREADIVFLTVAHRDQLGEIDRRRRGMARSGALWVLRPRGSADINESEVRTAGLAASLVDVKVVRFSETHTAEKFVYRLRDR